MRLRRSRAASPNRRSEKTWARSGCGLARQALSSTRVALRSSPPSASMRPASAAAGTKVGASFAASSAKALALSRSVSSAGQRACCQHAPRAGGDSSPCRARACCLRAAPARRPSRRSAQRNSSTALPAQPSDGINPRRFLGKCVRADVIVAAPGLDEQSMQAERLGIGAARHGAKGASAASRSPASCADCALRNSASGSAGAMRLTSAACLRAAARSPEPTAIRPREIAS